MGTSKLYQAVYVSKALVEFDKERLDELLHLCKKNNSSKGISGYLYFENGFFLQYIESENRKSIDDLLTNLLVDPRHSILNWITMNEIRLPRFPDWSMRYIYATQWENISLESEVIDTMERLGLKRHLLDKEDFKIWRLMDRLAEQNNI